MCCSFELTPLRPLPPTGQVSKPKRARKSAAKGTRGRRSNKKKIVVPAREIEYIQVPKHWFMDPLHHGMKTVVRPPTKSTRRKQITIEVSVATMDKQGHILWPTTYSAKTAAALRKQMRHHLQEMIHNPEYPTLSHMTPALTCSSEALLQTSQAPALSQAPACNRAQR